MAGNTAELLGLLRDIRVPEPPAEPAVWPLIIAVIVIACGLISLLAHYRKRRCRWAVQARQLITAGQQQTPEQAIQSFAKVLRRTVLTLEPQSNIENLHGDQWIEHLDGVFRTDYFTRQQGRVFGIELYQKRTLSPADRDAIAASLHKLLRRRSWRWW